MSISRQNLTAVIVTFKSEKVIHDCIRSISESIKIILVDNSMDKNFKENIEKKYRNVKCILSSENLGMGPGNNLGLKYVETDYAFVLNPDVILEKSTIDEIILSSQKIKSFSVIAPISNSIEYPNYKLDKNHVYDNNDAFEVKSVDGYAMLFNLKRLSQLEIFDDSKYFDENFFMYLENDDLCKRLIDDGESIYVIPKSKIKHLGAKAVDEKYKDEIELSRNWHWVWSKFYYNKKHFGFFSALINGLPSFISAIIKFLFYSSILKRKKSKVYFNRVLGFMNALLGKKSSYRPNLKLD